MTNGDSPLTDMTIRELDAKLDRMREELRHEMREYVDDKFVTRSDFDGRMTRLSFEVVREVSAKLQAMVKDAMQEVATETVTAFVNSPDFMQRFNELLDARKKQDRKDLQEDVRKAFGTTGRVVQYVNSIAALILALAAVWAIFFR